ncbi:MAG: nicotinate-nucleotide diphosphorylase [Halothiobacillus sp. 13-55-253]|nr:MAG: nicotinate-nucleotide diphosphorylase [Halothiobacillus sp. 13-55-253]
MIDSQQIADDVTRALTEDIGGGDVSARLVPAEQMMQGRIVARESCVLAGTAWAETAFRRVSNRSLVQWLYCDGDPVPADSVICTLDGPARALLTAERTALNFLQTLSGTATITRAYVDAISGTSARILDTRKTIPGLRMAQLEVEVETLDQLEEALAAGVDRILLDNFDLAGLRAAVAANKGRAKLEASGNVDLSTVRDVALTGVDFISTGAITKHVQAIDLSLRFTPSSDYLIVP